MTDKKDHLHHEGCEDGSCGCEEHGNNIVTLEMEDGSTKEFNVLHVLDYKGKHYVALAELDSDVYDILRFDEVEEEVELSIVEDDAEYDAVAELFDEFFSSDDPWDMEDEEDEEEEA